jgi:hypothetical protein
MPELEKTKIHYVKGGHKTGWVNVLPESCSIDDVIKEDLNNLLSLDNVVFLVGNGISFACNSPRIDDIYSDSSKNIFKTIISKHDLISEGDFHITQPLKEIFCKKAGCSENIDLESFLAFLQSIKYPSDLYNLEFSYKFEGKERIKRIHKKIVENLYYELKKKLIKEIKKINLANISTGKENYPEKLRKFLKLLTTRPENLKRASIFSLNYDMLLEEALENAGILYNNGFSGIINRNFSIENYDYDLYYPGQNSVGKVNRVDKLINLYKLHGSISWFKSKNKAGILEVTEKSPELIDEKLLDERKENESIDSNIKNILDNVLIYPTPLKAEETLDYPYSELFRRFYHTICSQQTVLFVIGYGFGDEHVNRIIARALSIPSFHLYIVNPSFFENPDGQSVKMSNLFVEALREDPRVTVLHGHFEDFIDNLPDLRSENINSIIEKTVVKLNALKKFS